MSNPAADDNPYAVLGVPDGADGDQVRRAYRRLAMRLHPDRTDNDPEAEARFKEVRRAYQTLKSRNFAPPLPPRHPPPAAGFSNSPPQDFTPPSVAHSQKPPPENDAPFEAEFAGRAEEPPSEMEESFALRRDDIPWLPLLLGAAGAGALWFFPNFVGMLAMGAAILAGRKTYPPPTTAFGHKLRDLLSWGAKLFGLALLAWFVWRVIGGAV